jgi:transcriptional regulator with XRE-family HTH domain
MAIPLDDLLAKLPESERAAIQERAAELMQEVESLGQLRKAREQSQQALAKRLGIQQAAVSKLERRTDLYLSTLREFITALGGELEVVARFPDAPPVKIAQFRPLKRQRPGTKPRRKGGKVA